MKKTSHSNKNRAWYMKYLLVTCTVLLLSACGGGGGGGNSGGSGGGGIIGTGVINGTAATGDAIPNATITLKSNTGETSTATTDANGKFEVADLPSGSFLMRVAQENGSFLYSMAYGDGTSSITRNIHPYTDLILRNWYQTQGLDITSVFTSSSAPQMPTLTQLDAIKVEIHAIIAQGLQSYGVDEALDLFATPFDADETGFDLFILNNPVIINNNQITIVVNDIDLNITSVATDAIDLNTDFTSALDSDPTTPEDVRALVASTTEIIVVWEASTDDKGVAAYNVYRNGTLIAITAYPVYRDTELTIDTEYSYEIEAIDGRAQTSIMSVTTNPITLNAPDTTAPATPTNVQVSATENDITTDWNQAEINDVYGFRILRGASGNATTEISNITSTVYNDFNLANATNYCYRVIAYDASGNESEPSAESCATTEGSVAGPSSVSFSAATYTVSENATSINVTVNRSDDISQAISVDYAASTGTAVEGDDFSATSGTLNWAANDGTAKTFAVQIISDNATEAAETVNLTLSNPSGNTSIGANTTAMLTITDFAIVACTVELTSRDITVDTVLSEPCYKIPNGINVENPAKLTISPGVRLEFAAGTQLTVSSGASLYAVGTATQGIVFTAQQATPGYWKGIKFDRSSHINNQLEYVTVEYGVNNIYSDSSILGSAGFSVKNTTSRYASNLGFYIHNSVQLDNFTNNTLTLNDRPISLPAEMVRKLGTDSTYSGNTDDRIHVFNKDIVTAQTWKKLDAPYYMSSESRYDVEAALVLEAGVSLTFNSGSTLNVLEAGSLKAIGTEAQPILFTGRDPSPGYWEGIMFHFSSSSNNQLDYVTVEYAGSGNPASSGNIGSVCFPQSPTRFSVTNSTIKDSFGWGVYRFGDETDGCYITLSGNTYSNNASGDF
ncbi:MAG: carboxypeptidase regulatory-like domain-containing protein [Thiomicrorhabdus sp.]|nr:carboxypeptidase regulatory-like domain-containing protein [Thiomicrorhabdus sp.]